MTSLLCKTCGEPNQWHGMRKSACEKFTPEDEFWDAVKKQQNQGCGKYLDNFIKCGNYIYNKYGKKEQGLCPKCKRQKKDRKIIMENIRELNQKHLNFRENQGCGKPFKSPLPKKDWDKCGDILDGRIMLCPECSKSVDTTNRNEADIQNPEDKISKLKSFRFSKTPQAKVLEEAIDIKQTSDTFCLKDYILPPHYSTEKFIRIKFIKEFIKILKEDLFKEAVECKKLLTDSSLDRLSLNFINETIDKRAGDLG